MRIDILAIGSRGDVQPYVALGVGLRMAGYRVRLVTLSGFEDLVNGRGLDHLPIALNAQRIADTQAGREWIKDRSTPASFMRGLLRVAEELLEEGTAFYWRNCQDVEALIVSPMGSFVGENIAERLRIPQIHSQFAPPVLPTDYDWKGRRNLLTMVKGRVIPATHTILGLLFMSKMSRIINRTRSNVLGLGPLKLVAASRKRRKIPVLAAHSRFVAPPHPDWNPWIHVTGFWFLDESPGWTPPAELVQFLDSGPRPIFIGFGSTPFPDPEKAVNMVVGAVKGAGQRAIILAGGTDLPTGALSPQVLSLNSLPHSWLLPRVRAAVHHGGAGVTGAVLRAGLPSVVVPVFADQPFWGRRVFELGAGPKPIPAKQLTQTNLEQAIRATDDEKMRQRCSELGHQIRGEDGVANAVQIIDKYFRQGAPQLLRHQHAG